MVRPLLPVTIRGKPRNSDCSMPTPLTRRGAADMPEDEGHWARVGPQDHRPDGAGLDAPVEWFEFCQTPYVHYQSISAKLRKMLSSKEAIL